MKIKVKEVAHHRNGVSGEGFHVVLFDWRDNDYDQIRHMVATVFETKGQCAVYDVDELKAGNIAFANGNSWRGDHFEDELRFAIEAYQDAR